jgi:hypothetical protein
LLSKEITTQAAPPGQLFVVTTKRVRAGKAPMAIQPTGWFTTHGGVVAGVTAKVAGVENLYHSRECFLPIFDAVDAVNLTAEAELRSAQAKLNKLSAKLRGAQFVSKAAAKAFE